MSSEIRPETPASFERSTDAVIVARGLSKRFALRRRPFDRLRRRLTGDRSIEGPVHWALRDVSFELARGETLGVMGRNGCGKSTLLEIVAGTLAPTSGEVRVGGQLAALLELGAAFSPELTGRENVFVYGSLLGMSRATIRERFDEIVEFAELRSYIDEPVKSYSSGMFVRLAFATAVSATPEILVIDEALAVGDEAFQRRCFARIEAMKQAGVSILFVSHAAGTVMELCDRVLLLDRGEPLLLGPPRDVIRHYHRLIYASPEAQEEIRRSILAGESPVSSSPEASRDERVPGLDTSPVRGLEEAGFDPSLQTKSALEYVSRGARIGSPSIRTAEDQPVNILRRGGLYFVCFRVFFEEDAFGVRPGMLIRNVVGTELGGVVSSPQGLGIDHVAAGTELSVRLPFRARLAPDTYFANVGVVGITGEEEGFLHRITDALAFRVLREQGGVVTGSVDFSSEEPTGIETSPPSPAVAPNPS
jgi:lipopolysaccharide transport system ATP-binding protein